MRPRPTPTAAEHVVQLDELFFSTTDRRGLIRAGNSVFVRISHYPLDELLGAPHNIIRHPDMPAGAFELMWERLLAGRPMGAYVQNMAADGATYWVFATVTPLGDRFLSVRSAPCADTFRTVREVYRGARAEEDRFAAAGHHRAEVARQGRRYLEQCVAALGFDSYEAFMFEVLMHEVSTRRSQLGPQAWARPDAVGPAADVLRTVTELDASLTQLGDRMARYRALADRLTPTSARMLASAQALTAASDHAVEASERTGTKVLTNVARVMRAPMHDTVGLLDELAARLGRVLHEAREAGFGIALAQLHAEMIVRFAIEVIDGDAPDGSPTEIVQLCDALHDDVTSMVTGIHDLVRTLRDVAADIDAAAAAYDSFGNFLAEWSRLAVRHLSGAPLRDVITPIEHELSHGRDELRTMRELAVHCREAAVPFDVTTFESQLDRMRRSIPAFPPPQRGR